MGQKVVRVTLKMATWKYSERSTHQLLLQCEKMDTALPLWDAHERDFNDNTLDLVQKRTYSSLGPVLWIFTAHTHFMLGCCEINMLTERWK